MIQRSRHEEGSARGWLLAGLGVLLTAAAMVLLVAVGGLGGGDDGDGHRHGEERAAKDEGKRPPPGSEYRGSMPSLRAGGELRKAADNTSELSGHLHKGGKTEAEMEAKYTGPAIDVMVKGPAQPDPRFPDLYLNLKNDYAKKIADCYKQSLVKTPSLRGSLVLNLSLAPLEGERNVQLQATADSSSTIQDIGLTSCIVRRVSRMRFDPIVYKKNKGTVFKYPITLNPGVDPAVGTGAAAGRGAQGQPGAPGAEPGKPGQEPGKPGEPLKPGQEPGKPGQEPPSAGQKPGQEPGKTAEPSPEPDPPPPDPNPQPEPRPEPEPEPDPQPEPEPHP